MWILSLALVCLITIKGAVVAQSKACLEIHKCVTPEFNEAVRGDEKGQMCKIFRESLNCMEVKIDECLPTLKNPDLGKQFIIQRDNMERNLKEQCGDKGSSESCSIENLQKCMAPYATMGQQAGDIGAMCRTLDGVKTCLTGLMDTCPELKDALSASLQQVEASSGNCAGSADGDTSGCKMENFMKCSKLGQDGDPKKACASYPEVNKCIMNIKKNCDMKSLIEPAEAQMKAMKEKCEKEGYSVGEGPKDAAGSLKPSILFVVMTALLLALRLHF